jgi:molybdopterin molybdotransferase
VSPRAPLMPLDEALAALLARALPLPGTESVPTLQADGRVLAQDLVSALQVPAFDNSAMDGYALRCADVAAPGIALPVSQRIAAGSVGAPLQGGTAARIFTGAPVPPGADAVVMQEDCVAQDDGSVRVQTQPHSGQNIRRAGEDIALGSTVLHAGTRLAPAALGLAASIGLEHSARGAPPARGAAVHGRRARHAGPGTAGAVAAGRHLQTATASFCAHWCSAWAAS